MPTGTGAGALAVRAQRALPYRALRAEADAGGRLPVYGSGGTLLPQLPPIVAVGRLIHIHSK